MLEQEVVSQIGPEYPGTQAQVPSPPVVPAPLQLPCPEQDSEGQAAHVGPKWVESQVLQSCAASQPVSHVQVLGEEQVPCPLQLLLQKGWHVPVKGSVELDVHTEPAAQQPTEAVQHMQFLQL